MTTDLRSRVLEFLDSVAATPSAETGRLELDSLALLQVVAYLEQNYAIRLSDHDIEPDDLRSIDGIVSLIQRLTHDAGALTS